MFYITGTVSQIFDLILSVREHKGWVRNVALIKCTLGPGKPKKGWNFGGDGTGARWGTRGVSLQATWD
jgi:hypothetical protein